VVLRLAVNTYLSTTCVCCVRTQGVTLQVAMNVSGLTCSTTKVRTDMGLQKYRASRVDYVDPNGTQVWVCDWMGGPTVSKLEQCPTPFGPRTVYVTGEPETFFTLPAACKFKGRGVRGYLTCEDGSWRFNLPVNSYWYPHVKQAWEE
jgi:hypothetical protein